MSIGLLPNGETITMVKELGEPAGPKLPSNTTSINQAE